MGAVGSHPSSAAGSAAEGSAIPPEATTRVPWTSVRVQAGVGFGSASKVVAQTAAVGFGSARVVVARRLAVGYGSVRRAIVFEEASVGFGRIRELHCVAGTRVTCGFGGVRDTVYHTYDELVAMACSEAGLVPTVVAASAASPAHLALVPSPDDSSAPPPYDAVK
jgi:hypothetical protein